MPQKYLKKVKNGQIYIFQSTELSLQKEFGRQSWISPAVSWSGRSPSRWPPLLASPASSSSAPARATASPCGPSDGPTMLENRHRQYCQQLSPLCYIYSFKQTLLKNVTYFRMMQSKGGQKFKEYYIEKLPVTKNCRSKQGVKQKLLKTIPSRNIKKHTHTFTDTPQADLCIHQSNQFWAYFPVHKNNLV